MHPQNMGTKEENGKEWGYGPQWTEAVSCSCRVGDVPISNLLYRYL